MTDRDAQLVPAFRERQRADELLKERDSQLLSERAAANKAESGWRTRERKLLDKLETARGQCGMKRTAPDAVQDPGVLEDKAWLTQCAVEWRTGLQQAATATALLEDSLKRADKESAPPLSSAADMDRLLRKYEVGDILQSPITISHGHHHHPITISHHRLNVHPPTPPSTSPGPRSVGPRSLRPRQPAHGSQGLGCPFLLWLVG